MIDIKIKKLKENAMIPTRSSKEAAGYDLYACLDCESLEIFPHTNVKIGTGFALEIPDGYFAGIFLKLSHRTIIQMSTTEQNMN